MIPVNTVGSGAPVAAGANFAANGDNLLATTAPVSATATEAQTTASNEIPTVEVSGGGGSDDETGAVPNGLVIGAAAGGALLLGICAAAAFFICCRRAGSTQHAQHGSEKRKTGDTESIHASHASRTGSDQQVVGMGGSRGARNFSQTGGLTQGGSDTQRTGSTTNSGSDGYSPTGVHKVQEKVAAAVKEMQGELQADLQKDQIFPLPQLKGLIGRGGFGTVYHGAFKDCCVAIGVNNVGLLNIVSVPRHLTHRCITSSPSNGVHPLQ